MLGSAACRAPVNRQPKPSVALGHATRSRSTRVVPRATPRSPLPPAPDVLRVRIPALKWSIENVEGKRLSIAIYTHLADVYGGRLTKEAAQEGLRLYGEVVDIAEARAHPGSHPNIDLLLRVLAEDSQHELLVERAA